MRFVHTRALLYVFTASLLVGAACSDPSSPRSSGGDGGDGGDGGGSVGSGPLPDGGAGGSEEDGGAGGGCPSPWALSTIDPQSDPAYTSLAIGQDGQVWVAYYDINADSLKVARSGPSGWQIEAVDGSGAGHYVKLAVVGSAPHLVYHDSTSLALKHAALEADAWTISVVDPPIPGAKVGVDISLVADKSGNLHASYYVLNAPAPEDNVRYATLASGTWTIETIQADTQDGAMTSIALHDGEPEIIYLKRENVKYSLYRAIRSEGAWSSALITSTYTAPEPIHLVVESTGQRHVFYYNGQLQERKQVGLNWPATTVAPEGFYSSIALGKDDVLHASYYSLSDGDLLHAHNQSGTWQPGPVDAEGNTGSLTSTAVDTSGRVHIAYRDNDKKVLRYAVTCP